MYKSNEKAEMIKFIVYIASGCTTLSSSRSVAYIWHDVVSIDRPPHTGSCARHGLSFETTPSSGKDVSGCIAAEHRQV